jgi:hypothetical protein
MNAKIGFRSLLHGAALLVFFLGMSVIARADNFLAAYNGVQEGVTVRTMDQMRQVAVIPMSHPVGGVAAGPNNDLYVVYRNHIYNYSINGTLIREMAFPDAGIRYTDVAVRGGRVYASYDGTQRGFTVRDLSLNQLRYVPTAFRIRSIAAGKHDDLYLASGNRIYHYSSSGALLATMTFPDPGIVYTNVAVASDRLLASYYGSQQGFTVRDLVTLDQYGYVQTTFDIGGIVAGPDKDLYLSSSNHLYNFSLKGLQKQVFTWPQEGLEYGDMSR